MPEQYKKISFNLFNENDMFCFFVCTKCNTVHFTSPNLEMREREKAFCFVFFFLINFFINLARVESVRLGSDARPKLYMLAHCESTCMN